MSDDLPPIDAYDEVKNETVIHADFPRHGRKIRVYSLPELSTLPRPRDILGDGFLSAGTRALIAGPPKSGKSHLATELLMTAACGGEWLGMKFNKPHDVLYFNAEIRAGYLWKRYEKVLESFTPGQQNLIRQKFHVTGRGDIDLRSQVHEIRELIEEFKPSFVCFDPLSQFIHAINESDNSEVRDAFTQLLNPLSDPGGVIEGKEISTLVVHHTRKGGAKEPFDAVRGAGFIHGWFDSGMVMQRQSDCVKLHFDLRNGSAMESKAIRLDDDTLRFEEFVVDGIDDDVRQILTQMAGAGWVKLLDFFAQNYGFLPGTYSEWSVDRKKKFNQQIYDHKHVEKQGYGRGTECRIKDEFLDQYLRAEFTCP